MFESATGLALLLAPSLPASLLFGVGLDAPIGLIVARIAGAALLALGLACWLVRDDGRSAFWCMACLRPAKAPAH